jgi:two-component system invasion response regulator UvrY
MMTTTNAMIRVLLVDDHSMVREGIRRILEDSGIAEIVDEASDGLEAIQKADKLKPDVIIMDLSMPGMSGLEAVGRIHAMQPETKILILTMHDNTQYAVHVLHAGASGFILKQMAAAELVKAIKAVHGGRTYVAEEVAERLMVRYTRPHGRAPVIDSLSGREFEVFTLLGSGSSVREASVRMGLSERTVSTYRARILEKLQLRNNAEIIRLALESGIIK